MATVSFTRSMKLNKVESEKLLDIIKSERKNNFKVTTPPAEEASEKTLSKVFGKWSTQKKDLRSILSDYGTERTQKVLSGFICENDEVQEFIRDKAIPQEERGLSRTILIFDEDKDLLVGFYALSIKSLVLSDNLNSSQKKSYFGTSQTNGNVIPAILIGQLGKNDAAKSAFTGSDLMSLIFGYIRNVDKLLPSVVSYVEHNGSQKLRDYYEKHDFTYLPRKTEEKEKALYCHVIKTCDIVKKFEEQ